MEKVWGEVGLSDCNLLFFFTSMYYLKDRFEKSTEIILAYYLIDIPIMHQVYLLMKIMLNVESIRTNILFDTNKYTYNFINLTRL